MSVCFNILYINTLNFACSNIISLPLVRNEEAYHLTADYQLLMMELTTIQNRIYEIRGQRVMLDFDLASLYGVETRALNQAVKRNIERFPEDFMFQLTKGELEILKSQIVTSSWGGLRKQPYALSARLWLSCRQVRHKGNTAPSGLSSILKTNKQ